MKMFKSLLLLFALGVVAVAGSGTTNSIKQQVVAKLVHKASAMGERSLVLDLDSALEGEDEVDALAGKGRRRRRRGLGGISKGLKKAGKGISSAGKSIAKGTTNAANTVASGTVQAANTVASGTVAAANTVGRAISHAAVTVGKGVVDAANAVVDVSASAFQAILDAVDCLREGPQACVIEMMPREFKELQEEMNDEIRDIGEDFIDIMGAAGNIAATAFTSLGCNKNTDFKYPDISFNGAVPSIRMKSKSVCVSPSFDRSEFAGAMEDLKEEVLDSTLLSRLLSIGGGNSLVQTSEGSELRSRVASGHELMGTPCNGFKGAFSLSAGGEYGGTASAIGLAIGFEINVGCNDGQIDASFRVQVGSSLTIPGQDAAFWSLSWEKEYPGDIDDDSMWFAGYDGIPYQVGVLTSGLSDWVDAKPFRFNGVSVDYQIPVQGGLIEATALRARSKDKANDFPGSVGFGLSVSVKMFPLS